MLAQEPDRSVGVATTLLEREAELGAIGEALALAAQGAGRPVLIRGPPGIGKTRLAQAAVEQATMAGFRICSARGTELERGFPFGLVRQLFEPVLNGSGPERTEVLFGAAAAPAIAVFEPPDRSVAAPPEDAIRAAREGAVPARYPRAVGRSDDG